MKSFTSVPSSALTPYIPAQNAIYSIDAVSRITHTPRHQIAVYCRFGLISPLEKPEHGGWFFNHETIRLVQRIEMLRANLDLNLTAVRWISSLLREVDELRSENRFARSRSAATATD